MEMSCHVSKREFSAPFCCIMLSMFSVSHALSPLAQKITSTNIMLPVTQRTFLSKHVLLTFTVVAN